METSEAVTKAGSNGEKAAGGAQDAGIKKDPTRSVAQAAADHSIPYAQLETAERVERMRQVVLVLDERIANLQGLLDQLIRHQHGPDGALVAPMRFGAAEIGRHRAPADPSAWF